MNPSGTDCEDNDGCKLVAQHPQCGFRLFDLWDRKDDTPSKPKLTVLDPELPLNTGAGDRVRRGACKGDRKEVCTTATKGCASGVQPCLGFTLRAEGKRP